MKENTLQSYSAKYIGVILVDIDGAHTHIHCHQHAHTILQRISIEFIQYTRKYSSTRKSSSLQTLNNVDVNVNVVVVVVVVGVVVVDIALNVETIGRSTFARTQYNIAIVDCIIFMQYKYNAIVCHL